MTDDRIMCTSCRELIRDNRCGAARSGRRKDVPREYGPPEPERLPRRCEFFAPLDGADDARTGRERYPALWAEYETKMAERAKESLEARQRGIARAKAAVGR